jgi:hypothetical protein
VDVNEGKLRCKLLQDIHHIGERLGWLFVRHPIVSHVGILPRMPTIILHDILSRYGLVVQMARRRTLMVIPRRD